MNEEPNISNTFQNTLNIKVYVELSHFTLFICRKLQRESESETKIESLRVRNRDRRKTSEQYRERERLRAEEERHRMTPKEVKPLSGNEKNIMNKMDCKRYINIVQTYGKKNK